MMVIMYTEARDSEAKTGEPFVTEQYLEDFRAGQNFRSGRIRIDAKRIKSFAAEFDPQPFSSRRKSRDRLDIRRSGRKRLAHRRYHDATVGRQRSEARWRHRWRRLRRIPVATTGSARG